MKKATSLLFLLLIVTPIIADDFGFRFGMKVSPNISWFRTETRGYDNRGLRVGFSYGLIVDYDFTENYSISTGLNFLRTGGKLNYDWVHTDPSNESISFDTKKQSTYRFRHLEIPLTLKLRTTEIGYTTYYGMFGLGLGFRTSAHADERISMPNGQYMHIDNEDVSDDIAFLRAGLILGGGLEYSFGGNTALLAGITFHNGFSNILDKSRKGSDYFTQNKPSAHNLYIELTVGVMF